MARNLRRRLTFANVCSFTALVFALGTGGAYAASIVTSNADVAPDTISGHAPPSGDHSNILAASVNGTDLATDSVNSTKIVDSSVGHDDLTPNSVRGGREIADGTVGNADLAADSVDSSKIATAAVANSDIATGAIDSNSVLNESLTSSDLATNSVGATEVANGSIDTGEIVDNSLFAADLAPSSVGSSEIAADAVGASEVANKSLTLSDIAGTAINGTISLSGIPNGRCTQVTFNVGGAQVGDSPIVTTRATIQNGIVLYPNRVPSAGHVEVNACNFTGTSMTPISSLPVRVITLR
jgi:hypothetical protein